MQIFFLAFIYFPAFILFYFILFHFIAMVMLQRIFRILEGNREVALMRLRAGLLWNSQIWETAWGKEAFVRLCIQKVIKAAITVRDRSQNFSSI